MAAPEDDGGVTGASKSPAPSHVLPPPRPLDIKSLTGKDLMQVPLAEDLAEQDAAIAAKLRDVLANDGRRVAERKEDRAAIEAFYRDRGFAPLWVTKGVQNQRASRAVTFLGGVGTDGLDPSEYPTPQFSRTADAVALVEDELRLTQSILTFARHARTGRIHFTRVSSAIWYDLQHPDPAEVLAAVARTAEIRTTLNAYHPQDRAYQALKAKLAETRAKKTGEKVPVRIPDGETLDPGAEDMRVPLLRRRLSLPNSDSWRYDEKLVAAVKTFQKSSGLLPDGLVGPRTVAELNDARGPSRAETIDTILVNMERWRWLTRDLGSSRVIVNIPDFTLTVFDQGKQVWATRIVVGKPGEQATPLMTDAMKYITVNPTWNVPPSIIRNEYLPVLQQDPNALARIGLKMSHNADGSIRIYQPPGERNALGRLRFNFPNKFLIYQHDTPDKHLFAKEARAYSHGCIRVQTPDKYAEVLLSISQPSEGFTAERIRSMYGEGERTIRFEQPIPVHMTYQTAFVDESGRLQIRKDIYGHDAAMLEQLRGSERQVAHVPIKHNYTSSNKPVMARVRESDKNPPPRMRARTRDYVVRRRGFGPQDGYYYDQRSRYDRRYAGPSYEYQRPMFFPFFR